MVFNQKEYQKAYREKNKEKIKAYYEKNKEIKLQYQKEYCEKNKGKILQYHKEYREKNKEQIKEYREKNKKSYYISIWKYRGLIDDYEFVYKKYIETTHCEWCKCELDTDNKTLKCMDHDHNTHKFRRICCKSCNSSDPWDKVTKVSCETTI